MKFHSKSIAIGVVSMGLLSLGLSQPASAQGIFERIFGGLRHAIEAPRPPVNISAFADPLTNLGDRPQQRAESGSGRAFCVRSCDGHFFPVQSRPGMSAAESCHAFCPAAKTVLYSGGNIDYAVANDGSRYADLDTAFAYRKQLVDGCTCNGRDAFGLARMDVKDDPTLRPGDVVATKSGLMAFTGTTNKVADFTPIDGYRGLPKTARDKLSEVKIMPPNPGAVEPTPATITHVSDRARDNERRRAQLDR
jgi:Protein of unknown function (DUF2865)